MKVIGFNEVRLEEILTYIKENDTTAEVVPNLSTAHGLDFKFSPKYVLKRLAPSEFVFYSSILAEPSASPKKDNPQSSEASIKTEEVSPLKQLKKYLPKVYGLINDSRNDKQYICMENFSKSSSASEIELKVGFYNYLPNNWEEKQLSKIAHAILLGSFNQGFRVCMAKRVTLAGETIFQDKIKKVSGVKVPVDENILEKFFSLQEDEKDKKEFLLKALDYYLEQLKGLEEIFSKQNPGLGYLVTAASVVFVIDLAQETFSMKFLDFGCTFPMADTRIWPDEQKESFMKIIQKFESLRDRITNNLTEKPETV